MKRGHRKTSKIKMAGVSRTQNTTLELTSSGNASF